MSEKMRVHILAKALNVNSKAIIDKCAAEGVESVKNHMSTLSAGLEATIREWFSEGTHTTTVETAERVNLERVRIARRKRSASAGTAIAEHDEMSGGDTATLVAEPPEVHGTSVGLMEEPEIPQAEWRAEGTAHRAVARTEEAAHEAVAPVSDTAQLERLETVGRGIVPPAEEPDWETLSEVTTLAPSIPETQHRDGELTSSPPFVDSPPAHDGKVTEEKAGAPVAPPAPAGPQNVPTPAKLRGPRVVRYEAPEVDSRPASRFPLRSRAPDQIGLPPREALGRGDDLRRAGTTREPPPPPPLPGTAKPRPAGRRHRGSDSAEKLREWNNRDLLERQERLAGATGRKIHVRRAAEPSKPSAPAGRKTTAEVDAPVTLKKFCAALGVGMTQLFQVLQRDHNMLATINTRLEEDLAQVVALEFGIELKVKAAKTMLDELKEEFANRERKHLKIRPPVVTFLGHVDHGKTSLLDAIRRAQIAKGEEGGITQHIGSYHFKRGDLAVTFLDTPGHKAFTAMRSRGARMTDIVVLVVAANDGVMPQTVEAINHAKAAGVPIVVALNKVDMSDLNFPKVYAQLSEQGLTPSGEWGGETDVIHTSATKGVGIDTLLEHLSVMSELREWKADATVEACGTVIEAETGEGVGSVVRLLVQEGTLREGKTLVCGSAYGKVRALLNDRGERIKAAGPSIPVEVWGLDSVPLAGDPFFEVSSMQRAKTIGEETRSHRADRGRAGVRKARSLEELLGRHTAESKAELNVIIKADVDGSIEALRQVLGELPTDQVSLTVRHSGVGAVTDSDVVLADACDAIIIAFHVVPVPGAKKLAEELGVDIRHYRVIYDVIDEIKKAMEGLLEPEETYETRGTVLVREVFRITKVGLVAGSYVSDGVVTRQHRARLIRDGVVIREDCKIDSLRRFKDDVKEVREGMECGIRLEGFEDFKGGDVIETYEVISVARTL